MLLRHTPTEVKEREALTINPAKTCQPVGAMYASLGVHGCLPHSHGSQGCCSYHRSALTRHYKEPVMAATSSFTEGTSVFGGQANMLQAFKTIFSVYDPEVVGVHTTCLSETIGDDLPQIIQKAKDEDYIPKGKYAFHVNTPSYVGSHVTGFANACTSMVKYFAEGNAGADTLTLFPGWVEPADMREYKRLMASLGIESIMYPDTSDVLDTPQTGHHTMFPKGGTTIADMKRSGESAFALGMGEFASQDAAEAINAKCKVPYKVIDLPIGLKATDRMLMALSKAFKVKIPQELTDERGRLVDMIADMQQYFYGKRVALFGDPDQLVALSEFLLTIGMKPAYIVTGTPGKKFMERMDKVFAEAPFKPEIKQPGDMFWMHQKIKNEGVDLLIGNTYGKYISRDENIPFVRYGFPILDRVGHQYFPSIGYTGGMRILEKILDALLDKKDRDTSEETFELVL
jgi:nitrogenase molybdenum-iron protein beta chain